MTDYIRPGVPDMPADYWKCMAGIEPLLKMGTPQRPKTWIVGFNGPRGGGKSGSAAWFAAAQNLVRGIPVFAIPESYYIEVKINWGGKVYTFHSNPLEIELLIRSDPSLHGSVTLADEANMQLADAHRSMANKNLAISDCAQQCRHLDISMIYTVIMAGWIDPRLRQLTDVLIYCTDAANSQSGEEYGLEEGAWVNWTVTDNSGMLTGVPYEIEPASYNWSFPLKDYWPIYESKNIADNLKARRNIEYKGNKIAIDITEDAAADAMRDWGERVENVTRTLARTRQPDGNGRVQVLTTDLQDTLGIRGNRAMESQLGVLLSRSGVIKRGQYYDLTIMSKDN